MISKNSITVFLLFFFCFKAPLLCQIEADDSQIEKIEIFYVAWKTRYQKYLSEEDLRDKEKSRSKFCIFFSQDTILFFLQKLTIINMQEVNDIPFEDPRIIMDFYFCNGEVATILIGRRRQIIYKNYIYINNNLIEFIQRILPDIGSFY